MKKLFTDAGVCLGCRYCEVICSLVHSKDKAEVNPRKARIRVQEDLLNGVFTPAVCKQCTKAPCIEACPYDAIYKDPALKVVIVDRDKCTGCLACLEACPFGAIFYDEEEQLPLICDLCGGDPMCVKFCRLQPYKNRAALAYTSPLEWAKVKALPANKPEST